MSSAINVLNHNTRQHQDGSGVSAEIEPKTLFSTNAEKQFVSYRDSGRVTISKATGQIKESHGVIFSRLQAMGNALLQLLFGKKSIRQQNISDCLRVAIKELDDDRFCKGIDRTLTKKQLQQIYNAGKEYFQSAKGSRDFMRLLAISAKLGITDLDLNRKSVDTFNLSVMRLINNFPENVRHAYLNACLDDVRTRYLNASPMNVCTHYLDLCPENIRHAYLNSHPMIRHAYLNACPENFRHAYLNACLENFRHAYLNACPENFRTRYLDLCPENIRHAYLNSHPMIRHAYLNASPMNVRHAYLNACLENIRHAYLNACPENFRIRYLNACPKNFRTRYLV